jgi:hypothetical protein
MATGSEDTGSPDVDQGIEALAALHQLDTLREFKNRIIDPYQKRMAEQLDAEIRKLLK